VFGSKKEKEGLLALVLHAHLPFVRHPEHEKFLEESWFFEALSETYLPLLRVFRSLEQDGIGLRLTISLSPTLTSMLKDELLCERYVRHLDKLLSLSDRELLRVSEDEATLKVVEMYRELCLKNQEDFVDYFDRDILRGFSHFEKSGNLELITTTATHSFLPMYRERPLMIRYQILVALENHESLFGQMPTGLWLPECGFYPGLEELLEPYNIKYFFSATHGVIHADEKPFYGVYAPLETPNGISVFARDRAASDAIWSDQKGFPCHPDYREFYRDVGFDLPEDYIAAFTIDKGIRVNTGFKYHAITGNTDRKKIYDPRKGSKRARIDALSFLRNRIIQCETISKYMDRPPLVVAAFNAELFGHWWFEGPQFLDELFRAFDSTDQRIEPVTPTDYLKELPHAQIGKPAFSSWGDRGYGQVWLNSSNDWIYRHIHKTIDRMSELVERFPNESGLRRRTLNQAARELLLSQASDWPSIIKSGTVVPYAESRVRSHINNFNRIYEDLHKNTLSAEWLTKIEKQNNLFRDIDYRAFAESKVL